MSLTLSGFKSFVKIVEIDLDANNFAIGEHVNENKARIGKVVDAVIKHLQTSSNPEDIELVSPFIEKIKLIDKQFEASGEETVFATSIYALRLIQKLKSNLDPSRQEIVKDPFILELKALAQASEIEDKIAVAHKLYNFQKNVLIPALESVNSPQELQALESIIDDCIILQDRLASIDSKHALKTLKSIIIELWNVKQIQTNRLYSFLVNFQKGQINNLESAEKRTKVAESLKGFISEFIKITNQPGVSQNDKVAIHSSLSAIYEEFAKHGSEKLLESTLRDLCKAVNLPFPQSKAELTKSITASSTNISQLRNQYEQTSPPRSSSPIKDAVKTKNTQTPEAIRDAAILRIQKNIAHLDINSLKLRQDVQEILSDISKLKKLDIMKNVDFSGLEEALNMLINPNTLYISQEENRFIELLLLKCSKSKSDLEKYSNAEASSVLNARRSLVKNLKANAVSLESLIRAASTAKETVRDQAIKERFDRLIEIHPLPTLTHNFAKLFPILVRNFEAFTREIVIPELDNKWNAVSQLYDSQTGGRFSSLLRHYSYMNPETDFNDFIKESQKNYFNKLNLSGIDKTSKKLLVSYLGQVVDAVKNNPGKLFELNYKDIYFEQHLWLLDNSKNIKVPFNQGDDIHENLGEGVCYNNSLFRFALIQDNPTISYPSIKMGSNSKTRFFQNKVESYYTEAAVGKITYQEAYDQQTDVAEEYGLQQFHKYTLTTPSSTDPHEFLVNEMERFAEAGHTQFILSLYSPQGGHAMNIQIDPANHMYRFFDDNIGLCQYNTLKMFKKEVANYFKQYYPTYNTFQFRLFKKL